MINRLRGIGRVIAGKDFILTFGKHKGKSLWLILYNDPSYILWLDREGAIDIEDWIVEKANEEVDHQRSQRGFNPDGMAEFLTNY